MHHPVLLNEVINYLKPRPNENFIDCTVGEAGHSLAILKFIKPDGKILAIDVDSDSLKRIKPEQGFILVCGNFRDLKRIIREKDFKPINGILFDLGLSSWQIEESGRGFSFKKDEPLLMNYESRIKNHGVTAEIIINRWPEEKLVEIFRNYGEERFSRRIARKIVQERKIKQIKTTYQLREIIEKAVPYSQNRPAYRRGRRGKVDRVLARIFQAVRIVVNDELKNLEEGLKQALEVLEKDGRLVIISFHSLEDRIVKNFFREEKKNGILKILTKKPVIPTEEEITENPRSRSAKLRAAAKYLG